MSARTRFVLLGALLLITTGLVMPANAQGPGTAKLIVEVTGSGSVTIDKDLVVKDPPYASDQMVDASNSPRTFWVTHWAVMGFSYRKVELRNPITNLAEKRFVWQDPYGTSTGNIRGMKVAYDSTTWTVTALGSLDQPIHQLYMGDKPCWKECNGIMLYGSKFHPPCCPTAAGGYDCSCTVIESGGYSKVCDPCYQRECDRPRRCRSLLSWLRGCD